MSAITNTALATAMSDLIAHWQDFQDDHLAWLNGDVGGGPNNDGKYPLTDYLGVTTLVTCPAQLEDDVEDLLTGAGASATAAAASASAASASATTATTQADLAATARTAAEAAETGAETAQSAAESARTTAIAQAAAAAASAASAETYADLAQAAAGSLTDPGVNAVMTWNDSTNEPEWSSAIKVSAGTAVVSTLLVQAAAARFYLQETGATANEGLWEWRADGDELNLYANLDDFSASHTAMKFKRTGAAVDDIAVNATTIGLHGTLLVSRDDAVIQLRDTGGSETDMTSYVSFQDTTFERGWIGFGTGSTSFGIKNNIGDINLSATLFSVGARTTITDGDGNAELTINSTHADGSYLTFQRDGTSYGYFGNAKSVSGGALDALQVYGTALVLQGSATIDLVSPVVSLGGCEFRTTSVSLAGTTIPEYADDAAAATAGWGVGGLYRTGSTLKIRVS